MISNLTVFKNRTLEKWKKNNGKVREICQSASTRDWVCVPFEAVVAKTMNRAYIVTLDLK